MCALSILIPANTFETESKFEFQFLFQAASIAYTNLLKPLALTEHSNISNFPPQHLSSQWTECAFLM